MSYNYTYSTHADVQIISVYYGNKRITDSSILDRIRHDLTERQNTFLVENNDLGGDPQPGVTKRLVVDYRDRPGDPHLRISAQEGYYLNFASRVSRVKYGGVELYDKPEVVERLNNAIVSYNLAQQGFWNKAWNTDDGKLKLTNESMGGDTRPGVEKQVEIQFLDRSDFEFGWETYDEHDMFPRSERAKYINSFSIPVMK